MQMEWHDELELEIDLTNGKTIKGLTSSNSRIRENDKVSGICTNYRSGKIQKLFIKNI